MKTQLHGCLLDACRWDEYYEFYQVRYHDCRPYARIGRRTVKTRWVVRTTAQDESALLPTIEEVAVVSNN